MPRKKNQLETIPVTISTTAPIHEYLQDLVDSGLYGKTPSEAAERLVSASIEKLIREATILKRRKKVNRRKDVSRS